jgi:hypothetical protein
MKKHFVIFFSPGTFVPEQTEREIDSWDTDKAVAMSREIVERHGAKPFGFKFITRGRGLLDLDSKTIKESGMYYLGGKVLTRAEIEARNDPKEAILRDNMRCNDIDRVIQNDNSWRYIGQFHDGDTLLDMHP